MTTDVATKTCIDCGLDLPLGSFSVNRPGRLHTRCRPCYNVYQRNYREQRKNPAASPRLDVVSNWRDRAACRDEDGELFFPIGNTGAALLQIEEAKSVCRRCPEMEACLRWALESGTDDGVWGGMSEDERRALKRKAARNRARATASQEATA